jgi:hypothetical protein
MGLLGMDILQIYELSERGLQTQGALDFGPC